MSTSNFSHAKPGDYLSGSWSDGVILTAPQIPGEAVKSRQTGNTGENPTWLIYERHCQMEVPDQGYFRMMNSDFEDYNSYDRFLMADQVTMLLRYALRDIKDPETMENKKNRWLKVEQVEEITTNIESLLQA
jgi:hypothetical protein